MAAEVVCLSPEAPLLVMSLMMMMMMFVHVPCHRTKMAPSRCAFKAAPIDVRTWKTLYWVWQNGSSFGNNKTFTLQLPVKFAP